MSQPLLVVSLAMHFALTQGRIFADDFRIVEPLDAGGMGSVYVVEQLSTGKRRALKLMHAQLLRNPKLRERFTLEARVGAQIASEHVVEVITAGVDAELGAPYLVMELLDGVNLERAVESQGPFSRTQLKVVFSQLAHALEAAHDQGIVHRDLKPENLFLSQSRVVGVPFILKVLDFGVAKIIQEVNATGNTTTAIGTPLWMAPEQGEDSRRVTPATDVWAVGLIAFYLATGKIYWLKGNGGAASMTELLTEVLLSPMATASERARVLGAQFTLPAGFDAWFARCVARDVAARYPNARVAFAAFSDMLSEAVPPTIPMQHPPHAAYRPPPPQRVQVAAGRPPSKLPPTAPSDPPNHPTRSSRPLPAPRHGSAAVGRSIASTTAPVGGSIRTPSSSSRMLVWAGVGLGGAAVLLVAFVLLAGRAVSEADPSPASTPLVSPLPIPSAMPEVLPTEHPSLGVDAAIAVGHEVYVKVGRLSFEKGQVSAAARGKVLVNDREVDASSVIPASRPEPSDWQVGDVVLFSSDAAGKVMAGVVESARIDGRLRVKVWSEDATAREVTISPPNALETGHLNLESVTRVPAALAPGIAAEIEQALAPKAVRSSRPQRPNPNLAQREQPAQTWTPAPEPAPPAPVPGSTVDPAGNQPKKKSMSKCGCAIGDLQCAMRCAAR